MHQQPEWMEELLFLQIPDLAPGKNILIRQVPHQFAECRQLIRTFQNRNNNTASDGLLPLMFHPLGMFRSYPSRIGSFGMWSLKLVSSLGEA
jgi:hypothetical protein